MPFKGLDARSPLAGMSPDHAIALENVLVETFGLRTRKGYTEYATGLPEEDVPVSTLMVYYPPDGSIEPSGAAGAGSPLLNIVLAQIYVPAIPGNIAPPMHLFAAQDGDIFDVTGGGTGPFSPEAGVSGGSDFWTWINFQNVAGNFLLTTNDDGGYAIFDGVSWVMPIAGAGAGEIDGVDPANLVFIMEWKERVFFIEKESTSAWYLDVDAITGPATEFDFGAQFAHGGYLAALANWTIDSGNGIDDRLIAVGSQGDVVIYEGTDPDDPTKFLKIGTYYVGPLPRGRRAVLGSGGDVYILTQFGVMPVSRLQSSAREPVDAQAHLSYRVDPLLARLMQLYAAYDGWSISVLAREELLLIQLPPELRSPGGNFLAYKTTTQGWSLLYDTRYACLATLDNQIFAGTYDGRVVSAFNGSLDNVLLATPETGDPILSRVIPAFQPIRGPGRTKEILMIRPVFLTVKRPKLNFRILTDYGAVGLLTTPTIPGVLNSYWDDGLWDVAIWSGLQTPIKEWLGARGTGFVATVELLYSAGGDTVLMSTDFWTGVGGVL